jgi:regulator of RNase E activity RraA
MPRRGGPGSAAIRGAIRDSGHVRSHDVPVPAAGVTRRGPFRRGPGEVTVPIAINGMGIEPGDLIPGDDDGMPSSPSDQVEEVHGMAAKRLAGEKARRDRGRNGTVDRTWTDARLEACGFRFEYLRDARRGGRDERDGRAAGDGRPCRRRHRE